MSKKPRRQNLKPPGRCVFCLDGAVPGNPMTGEHLWSDWMSKAKLLPEGGEYIEFKNTFRRQSSESISLFTRTRQGTANTKTIKVVCQRCNSGWMGTLEREARPFLTPLIQGASILLDSRIRRTLAEWVVMKVLIAEHNQYSGHPADPIFDQAARTTFKGSRAIPDGIRIVIGMQESMKWVTGFHRHATGLGFTSNLPPSPPPITRTKNVQSVTWGMGKFLVHVTAATDPNVFGMFALEQTESLQALWPLTIADITWPPRFFVTDPFIDDLASALERYINSPSVIHLD